MRSVPARVVRRTVLFAAIAAVQVAVPLVAMRAPPPARFGWQMFAGVAPRPRVQARDRDGALRPVDLDALLGNPRGDLRIPAGVGRDVCPLGPVALAVVLGEIYVGLGLWSRRQRRRAAAVGVTFHVGLPLLLPGDIALQLVVFGLEMVALYPLYLPDLGSRAPGGWGTPRPADRRQPRNPA